MSWTDSAHDTIQKVHSELPKGVSFSDRKKAVDAAYPFGERKYWPYKAWLKARKAYLARYDDAPAGPLLSRLDQMIARSKQ